ncbi:efflux RND transporter periplasmic adaptor subunit [Brevibacillus ruminantium]|uniref:Efflux RND transporter periplasmic adaptor subunit n=1 Tax=Brevibacillus ruminantium TaxID=2950604 RepID=A0ABY4WGT1_9BACL|nr:efflux RND transporter periplasmic adaptor subunit [Brevibacillus ruminantium]USG65050.1 efflux RND transporter periplasmic adaptor subunit [Brevibacillus ruminantium]
MNSRILLVNLLLILIIFGGLAAGLYYYNQNANYISTDNARVDGQQITISAVASGRLTEWRGQLGQTFAAGNRIGSIAPIGQTGTVAIDFPVNGTVVQQSVVPNSFVAAGTVLARAYDLSNLWITANIEETRYNDVKVGQAVDIYIDAFPGIVLSGRVDKIGQATAGSFSLMPSTNTTANYTKVAQVLPVTIVLDGYKGVSLAPGMSATVRIHI